MSDKLKGGDEMVDVLTVESQVQDQQQEKYIERSSHNFAMILYVDEDSGHKRVFDYLTNHKFQFDMLYIDHLPELKESDSEEKHDESKKHRHVLIRTRAKYTTKGLLKFFNPYLKFIVKVNSVPSYVMYMLHDTVASENKIQYKIEDFQGSKELIREAYDIRNLHFIQLGEFAKEIVKGATLTSLVTEICDESNEDVQQLKIETMKKYDYLTVAMCQEQNTKQMLRYRKKEIDINEKTLQLHMTGEI